MMDLKNEIEKRAGVPAYLLTGETEEEILAQAKALIVFKKTYEPVEPKSPREQFYEWQRKLDGIETGDEAGEALAEIENERRPYPFGIRDAGEVEHVPDGKTAKEHFEEWFTEKTAVNINDIFA